MAHVYLDGSVKAKIRIAQGNQVTDLMSSGWTDERHTDYISSMEASFINRLYNHGNNADKKDPGANGFKVLQRGAVVWKKVEFERPNACAQVGAKQSPPASRWIQRFTSRDCSSSAGGDGAETSVGDHESGIRTIPGGTPLFHRRELGACKGENLLNENSEGSDQNFADDDEAEVDEESSKACKKRRLSSSSTYCPQMTNWIKASNLERRVMDLTSKNKKLKQKLKKKNELMETMCFVIVLGMSIVASLVSMWSN
ncbi:cold-regulated protein 28-like isoform X3 [Hordeum vulgare subsp. vulgare]|uniref:cold-regulated protein 28-like isoform X3 n=1 Tax=Hordeum vulgare subsp. vulgare TaxID=112509 RepID=UPI001D1A433B|nr:cold-regulated protein 28-like isoform X3 [Hordeum vulgare subsp. vulgare]